VPVVEVFVYSFAANDPVVVYTAVVAVSLVAVALGRVVEVFVYSFPADSVAAYTAVVADAAVSVALALCPFFCFKYTVLLPLLLLL
jgi:hypothetical protein